MADGYCSLVVKRIEVESDSAKSYYLADPYGKLLAPYRPGQHLQFRVLLPDRPRPVARFYTLSDCANGEYYRLTIKKELSPRDQPDAPPGAVSHFFHDQLEVGNVLEAKPPSGDFYLDLDQNHPVVLIAGGIGVTPLLSMVNAVVKHQPDRVVYFLYAVRYGGDHAFKDHLREIAAAHPNIHLHVCYDGPREHDVVGVDYDWAGRIDLGALTNCLPSLQMDYYLCGPGPMMDAVVALLQDQGVASQQIHTESFGPASTAYRGVEGDQESRDVDVDATAMVCFARSGKSVPWDAGYESLLQFAEDQGVPISAGCLYGDCATCMTGLLSGEVQYNHATAVQPETSACLPCSCRPMGSITLDV